MRKRYLRIVYMSAFTVVMGIGIGCTNNEVHPAVCDVITVASGLDSPYGIIQDGDGYLLTVNGGVVRINASGAAAQVASVSKDSFSGLIRLEGGDVAVIDNRLGDFIRFDAEWMPSTIASGIGNAVNVVSGDDGLVITDFDNHVENAASGRLLLVDSAGNVSVIADSGLGGASGVAVSGDSYYVTDFNGGFLLLVDKSGNVETLMEGLGNPVDIKKIGGIYYISDFAGGSSGGRILMLSPEGDVDSLDVTGLGSPAGLFFDGTDLLVTDISGGRLLRITGCVE